MANKPAKMAIGTEEFHEELMLFQEALRFQVEPDWESLKFHRRKTFALLDKTLRIMNKWGGFRKEIYKSKHVVDVNNLVFSIDEDNVEEMKARQES